MKHVTSIIRGIQQTEKGTDLTGRHNQYLLEVSPQANKIEIKAAVQEQFGVTVLDVNTMNYRGRMKILRNRRKTRTSDWKRAVVTLKGGDRIDVV